MYTVIMPTMFIPNNVSELVEKYTAHPLVSQFILIDNCEDDIIRNIQGSDKLVYVKEGTNTYVNPAWNKGYTLSNQDKLVFVNDDLDTDLRLLELMQDEVTEDRGIIGLSESCINAPHPTELRVVPTEVMGLGYACLFFIHRKSYKPIPDCFKIWYGDNFLFKHTGKQPYVIENWAVHGELSRTVSNPTFGSIVQQDSDAWHGNY